MSNYDSEEGSIILPSAAAAPLKAALRTAVNTFHEDVRVRATELHKSIGTRSVKKYGDTLREALTEKKPSPYTDWRYRPIVTTEQIRQRKVNDAAASVLYRMLSRARRPEGSIKMPTVKDVAEIAPKVTNRDNVFLLMCNQGSHLGAVSFNGRSVTWDVGNGNHTVDRAKESIVALAFFEYLNGVKWTAKTGGVLTYKSEYHEDDQGPLDFGSTISGVFGPVGEKYEQARIDAMVAMSKAMFS